MTETRPQPAPPGDPTARSEDLALARRLLQEAREAALASVFVGSRPREAGWPFASLVLLATDAAGRPILLLSDLAEHAKNIRADARVSLLIDGTEGHEDRLAAPRLTLLGRAEPIAAHADRAAARASFLVRHPSAATYADFNDFRFYRVALERAHLVAGFGRIRWIEGAALLAGRR
jgi:putative heme iron utilization protein